MNTVSANLRAFIFRAIVLVVPFCMVGCGRASSTSDGELVMEAVSNLSDAARDQETFRELFVDGKAPDSGRLDDYARCLVNMEPPQVDGLFATAEVRVTIDGRESTHQWSFARTDGVWKIQEAPLPGDL